MKSRNRSLVLLAVLVIMTGQAIGQESLKDIVTEQGVSWLIGRWTATTDDGDQIQVSYRWGVEGHAIIMDLKMGDTSSHSMIYYIPDEAVVSVGIDSKGRVSKGMWESEYGDITSKIKSNDEYGQEQEMGIVYSKKDAKSMTVKVYGVKWGELSDDPWATLDFKRQARPARKAPAKTKKDEK
jgi:hypothetical protein